MKYILCALMFSVMMAVGSVSAAPIYNDIPMLGLNVGDTMQDINDWDNNFWEVGILYDISDINTLHFILNEPDFVFSFSDMFSSDPTYGQVYSVDFTSHVWHRWDRTVFASSNSAVSVSEPSSAMLLMMGLGSIIAMRRRQA